MSNIVIMGAQWGDEGKGKIVDLLTLSADVIVRFQGGNNAGHTLVVGGEQTILHLIPSGILHQGARCCIGNGVVLDPQVFCAELDKLADKGVDVGPARVTLSPKTHVIMPYHKRLDVAREAAKSDKIGTTGRGIGPCYEDKMSRIGVRAGDFTDLPRLKAKIAAAVAEKNVLFTHYGVEPLEPEEVFEEVKPFAQRLAPHLADVSSIIQQANAAGKTVLFEGAQGTLLDIDHGTYPFVTSSNTVAGNAAAGAGVGPRSLERIVGIVKAYTTRVGGGPFPTELFDAVGEHLQGKGAEFGATTGRRRRCGWLDMAALREAVRLSTPTELAITKLDVLSGLGEIKIGVAYEYGDEVVEHPPQFENALADCAPVYETHPGWDEDITTARSFEDLPEAARNYIHRIEELSGVRVGIISVGPDRDQTIIR